LQIAENSEYVDGIGGVIWDGAIIMSRYEYIGLGTFNFCLFIIYVCRFLENILDHSSSCHILELGCGAGEPSFSKLIYL